LQLAFAGLILGVGLAIPLGIFAAKHAGTIWDNLTTVFSLFGLSMPGFWLGLLLLIWFSYRIKLFPAGYDGTWRSFVLPAVTTGFAMMATTVRQMRSAMLEVMRQDFLRTARAKGVSERHVTTRHALRNAWIPVITTIGMTLSRTLAGSAVVEAVYSWPGIGRLMIEAISQRDVTLACGCVVLTCITYVIMLLLVDLMYALVDPRIRARYASVREKRRSDE
jgi:peptide/nickel transport system permease protein